MNQVWFHKCDRLLLCQKHAKKHKHWTYVGVCFEGWRKATEAESALNNAGHKNGCSACFIISLLPKKVRV
jgi:hypothetical protein